MPRSGSDARRRLRQAAVELFGERGFDRTTAAEIAARAGVTERTYFRHFADKREVLFDGEEDLHAALVDAVADAPADLSPFEVLLHAFRRVGRALEAERPSAEPRREVIAATPALRERELAKHAALADTVAGALRRRGVPDRQAGLAAQTGWATYREAVRAWDDDPATGLDVHLTRAFDDLRALAAAAPLPTAAPGR